MKYFIHKDNSITKIYQPGDQVILKENYKNGIKTYPKGTRALVIDRTNCWKSPTIDSLRIKTKKGECLVIPPWYLKPLESPNQFANNPAHTRLKKLP